MESAPARLRGKPSWLISKTSLHAQRLIGEVLTPVDARGHHFAILAALEEFGPASQIALGQRCGIDRSDTHATVNELADQGLVERAPDPADRRRNIITLTPAGRRRLEELDSILAGVQEELLRPLSEAERTQLLELLRRVFDHVLRR
ncbi:MarR family winged helix-turn-helix transcriptional regulator [Nonomuraea sp. NPDC052129]|uniref:MarR family winged helix-turn-helix transcriptional regulator n=1 Tax=Nonomuraea sp. NPDC052129 TaxID=3154651 RepID=UPI00341C70CA